MKFSPIPREALSRVPRVMDFLKRVEPHLLPRCDAFDIYMMCVEGQALVWGVFDDDVDPDTLNEKLRAVAVTKVTAYPKGLMLTIPAMAGDDVDEWLDLVYETLTKFWKSNGFLGLEEWGRPGWVRKLSKYGFRKSYILMEDFDGQGLVSEPHDFDGHSDKPA